jgi:methylenetetrahydrofolate reductase (NADPH)
MTSEKSGLAERIASGKPLILAEIAPPAGSDAAPLTSTARLFAGKVHALGISDNRDGVCMSSLVAASLVAAEGLEPILHVVTRDRNRVALVSDWLGARALGIHNVLCTSGTHQTLTRFRAARNVFDIDCVQLLQTYANLGSDAALVGEECLDGAGSFCLGGVASPMADPLELQTLRLAKKVAAGAKFLITQPVFDLERFNLWMDDVRRSGLHQRVAIVAGILPLTSAAKAREYAQSRPSPRIPQAMLEQLDRAGDAAAQRAAGIQQAVETIRKLSAVKELRGFQVSGEWDAAAAVETIEKAGLQMNA